MLNSIKPVGTRPGTIYELCKVQKQKVDGWPPFKTILTVLQTPTYNPAKFLVPILTLWAPTPQNGETQSNNLPTNCLSRSSHFVGLALKGLNTLTKNDYTVKDSFHFAEEICKQDPLLSMGSLDVNSLFTNIPLDETLDICINQ